MARHISSVEDARRAARRRVPRMIFDYVEGGAEDEVTLRANRRAFERLELRPRRLVDVSTLDQSTTVLGTPISTPVLLAPVGLARLVAREGEVAAARAAGRHGTAFVVSTMASRSIERVAGAASGPLWFQLYVWRRRDVVEALVRRARDAGCSALVVAVDVPVVGKRERDVRNGFTVPPRLRLASAADVLRRPRWVRDVLVGEPVSFEHLPEAKGSTMVTLARYVTDELTDPSADLEALRWVRGLWDGPLAVKGIMTADDARRVVDCGVDGVIVSNHGGRQLDGEPATLSVLPEIVDAVAGRAEVLLDGGVRRGTDVVKAIALGARACLVGRPYVYGLAAAGERGVSEVLDVLRSEIDTALALLGRPRLADVDRSTVGPIAG